MSRPTRQSSTPRPAAVAGVAVLFLALAVLGTWPVARAPGHQSLASLTDNDFRFNIYVIFWGAHALVTDPLNLHHTNMFHPERHTFAYSDIELAHSLLTLPVILLSGNPMLVFNLLLMAVIVIGGTGCFVLARHVLGPGPWNVLAAAIYVFNPAHFTRYQQIQLFGDHWMPWLAWALLRWMEAVHDEAPRRRRWALAAAGFLCLHVLSGSHNAVFGALLVAVLVAVHATALALWRRPAFLADAALAALLCAVVLGPVLWPYAVVEDRLLQGRDETVEELAHGSAAPLELLSARSTFYDWVDAELGWPAVINTTGREVRANLFPGAVPLLLAAAGLMLARPWRRRHGVAWLLFGGLCFWLALGPAGGLYLLMERLPVLRLIRVPSRFMIPAAFALALLAGYGAAALYRRLGSRAGTLLLAALALVFAVEAAFVPLETREFDPHPGDLYLWLGEQPGDFAVVEFPLDPHNYTIAMRQVFRSTHHWKKLLVGYSGFQSQQNVELLSWLGREFPSPAALERLRELDVRYVIALEDRMRGVQVRGLHSSPALELVRDFDGIFVYELLPRDAGAGPARRDGLPDERP